MCFLYEQTYFTKISWGEHFITFTVCSSGEKVFNGNISCGQHRLPQKCPFSLPAQNSETRMETDAPVSPSPHQLNANNTA